MRDEVDWDQVVEELGPRLFNYLRRRGCGASASDLTQETLIRLVEKVEDGSFNPQKGSLIQFAFGISRNVYFEHQRLIPHEEIPEDLATANCDPEEKINQAQTFQ